MFLRCEIHVIIVRHVCVFFHSNCFIQTRRVVMKEKISHWIKKRHFSSSLAAQKWVCIWHKNDNRLECIMGSITMKNPWHLNTTTFDALKEAFLAKEWNYFNLTWKEFKIRCLTDFLHCQCVLNLEQPLTPPVLKIIGAFHTLNHKLAVEICRWSVIPIPRENKLCHFCTHNVTKNETHFVLECHVYISNRDMFPSLFQSVVFKSISRLEHQIDSSLYLMARSYCSPLF